MFCGLILSDVRPSKVCQSFDKILGGGYGMRAPGQTAARANMDTTEGGGCLFLSVRLCTNFMCSDTTMEDKDEINIKQLNLETTIIQTFRVRYQICTSNANSCFLCMTEQQVYSTIIVSKKVFHVSFSIVFCTVEKCTVNRDETNECLV